MQGYKTPPAHEVEGLARRLIREHGDLAAREAGLRADEKLDACDFGGQKKWILVLKAIEALQQEPAGETTH